ncbi:MAG TPA: tRNA (adenosine(37)-N6)-threonylcarbamoyltransferase complex ATPase subunit type 1 TsaE [Acidimicrobiales bacterium]|nr:tRNA (adenosine(37)-N6)-threonylcarbamoyltransferase complex ATPase subunit type 1 TsaE [Acidimicrobiales bacterium]
MTDIVAACPSPHATRALAGRLAGCLQPGDVLLLEGDLGAGKTTFTQGLAAAVGVDSGVTSPTFTLMNIYPTTAGFDLVHVDVYRLEHLSEVVDLALPEMLEDGAVAVVEWGERAAAALPGPHLRVRIERSDDDDAGRVVHLQPSGTAWEDRRADLARLVLEAA